MKKPEYSLIPDFCMECEKPMRGKKECCGTVYVSFRFQQGSKKRYFNFSRKREAGRRDRW